MFHFCTKKVLTGLITFQANLALGEPEIAKVDFEMVLKQDATNKAAIQQLAVCNQKLKEQRAREKQIYTNMFEKFAQKDREVSS